MAGLSRTEKYKDLRARLQVDTKDDLSTKALNPYESRLNRIDANNFAAPSDVMEDDHSALHARIVKDEQPVLSQPAEPLHRTQHQRVEPSYMDSFKDNENYSSTFDNDYLDQYIREVKQYNLEQGSAFSDNTQLNVLRQLQQNKENKNKDPYAGYGNSPLNMPKPPVELDEKPTRSTTEIPFQDTEEVTEPVSAPVKPVQTDSHTRVQMVHQNAPVTSSRKAFTDELFENDDEVEEETNSQNLTKEDIMAEVQNLVNGTGRQDFSELNSQVQSLPNTESYQKDLEAERTARQQLLNETTQMRAQLDDYEDNLNEVSDKMRHTNKILNIVLVILIIALAVILGIVIYWIVLSKG